MTVQPQMRPPRPPSADTRAVLVVGHDRFPRSDAALTAAADLARRLHAVVHVVRSVSLRDYPIDPDAANWEEQAAGILDMQRRTFEGILADTVSDWCYYTGHGDPVELLAAVAEAHDAMMIVVGTRGTGAPAVLERLFGRSVSRGVIRRQRRPALVVQSRRIPIPPATGEQRRADVRSARRPARQPVPPRA
jgi:nucleotide-binding universal stress UspA family protein